MSRLVPRVRLAGLAAGAVLAAFGTGCQTGGAPRPLFGGTLANLNTVPDDANRPLTANRGPFSGQSPYVRPAPKSEPADNALLPKELNKVTMPPYTVEAPDLLLIDAQRLIPLPPYKIEPLDVLYVYAPKALDKEPINGPYPVDPDGTINLGTTYGGSLRVNDLTVPEIEKLVSDRLKRTLTPENAVVTVSLAQSRGVQQIRGEHLVQPDGTVSLGLYGSVYVAGMRSRRSSRPSRRTWPGTSTGPKCRWTCRRTTRSSTTSSPTSPAAASRSSGCPRRATRRSWTR